MFSRRIKTPIYNKEKKNKKPAIESNSDSYNNNSINTKTIKRDELENEQLVKCTPIIFALDY